MRRGIRRCVEIRYSDDCLGNEAIRFCKSELNGLIILSVFSKIIKDKNWLKIWSVRRPTPEKGETKLAHDITCCTCHWSRSIHMTMRSVMPFCNRFCSRPPAQYLHKAKWEWIHSHLQFVACSNSKPRGDLWNRSKGRASHHYRCHWGPECLGVLGFGQSMVFCGSSFSLMSTCYGHCRVGCPNGSLTPARPQNEAAVMVMLTGPWDLVALKLQESAGHGKIMFWCLSCRCLHL